MVLFIAINYVVYLYLLYNMRVNYNIELCLITNLIVYDSICEYKIVNFRINK